MFLTFFGAKLPEVESRTQGSTPRPRKQKKSEAKDSPSKDIPSRGKGQECSTPRTKDTGASVLQKNRSSKNFFQAIFKRAKQKMSPQIFCEVSGFFVHNFINDQIPTNVGTDGNAHHTKRRSSDINPQEDLLAYCVSTDLNFCNVGNKPTFRTKTREEVLDLI